MSSSPTLCNPHATHSISLVALINSLRRNRHLILQMAIRAVQSRYKGSVLGLVWSFFNPLFLLIVYTFVFSVVFKARWAGAEDDRALFAIVLFVGILIHSLFADILNSAPTVIVSNVNYVKKVVFPIEVLPVVNIAVALFHHLISQLVLFAALVLYGGIQWTIVFMPLILLPLVLLALGIAWILAALGVFLRDTSQIISLCTAVLMFLAPVFYPVSAVPQGFRQILLLNPLTFIIEQARAVCIWGVYPDLSGLGVYSLVALFIAWTGFAMFQKMRKGFADVL